MDFKNDKLEIMQCVKAIVSDSSLITEECINRFTEYAEDDYLNQRAEYLRNEIDLDEELHDVFSRLAMICDVEIKDCENCPVNKYCNHYINNARRNVEPNALRMIDLFCGAGGLSLGFTQEGFLTSLANDIQDCCIDTYAHNHPATLRKNIILGDIKDVADNIENLVEAGTVDIVVGGPPCQGFSMANRQRLIDDPRNHLYKNYVKIVEKIRPPFFVMENVKGMFSVANQVVEDFEKIGYKTVYKILNAKDFGVPQNRERLIYIGNNIGVDNTAVFEEIIASQVNYPNTVLEDALLGLRELQALRIKNATELGTDESGHKIEKNNSENINDYLVLINQGKRHSLVFNHKARYNNDRDIEIFSRLNQGDRSDDPKIADIMPYARRNGIFKDKYFKLVNAKICKTITAHMKFDCNMYIHPTQARGLTPREAARIQSYPDDYFFRGAYTKTYMQIGNSVPPLLGRAIAHILKKYLTKERNE